MVLAILTYLDSFIGSVEERHQKARSMECRGLAGEERLISTEPQNFYHILNTNRPLPV